MRPAEPYVDADDLVSLVRWLQWNDPNGEYLWQWENRHDADMAEMNNWSRITLEYARRVYREQREG